LFTENNFRKYFLYAIGEIFLVVIGILIALQINNNNEKRKLKVKELVYLNNIKLDLQLNIKTLEEFIQNREITVEAVDSLLIYFNKKKEPDPNRFNFFNVTVLDWYPFVMHNNTYEELMNSGNFALISNKSIKNDLQNMEAKYEMIKFIENEMQQDYERYLYEYFFDLVDLETSLDLYEDQMNNINDKNIKLNADKIYRLLDLNIYKSGLVLARFNSIKLLEEYQNLVESSNNIMELIDEENRESSN
jgi:hypothetical protein